MIRSDFTIANLFEQDIKASYEEQGYFGRRLRDMVMKFGSGSPFDFLIFNGEILMGIEAKQMSKRKSGNPKSISFNRISDTQREGLKNLNSFKNTLPLLAFNWRWCDNKKGETYILTIDEFLDLEESLNRKSIPLSWFRENGYKIERKGTGWDLKKMFNKYKEE